MRRRPGFRSAAKDPEVLKVLNQLSILASKLPAQ